MINDYSKGYEGPSSVCTSALSILGLKVKRKPEQVSAVEQWSSNRGDQPNGANVRITIPAIMSRPFQHL